MRKYYGKGWKEIIKAKAMSQENKINKDFEFFKDHVFKHTLVWEGGGKLHNVKNDSGGWTIWGIAYNHNKGLFKDLADFKDTTYDEAAEIAYKKYYLPIQPNLLPESARLMYFDMAYNMGNRRAIILMQRCAGVAADGKIGPITKRAMPSVTEECLMAKRKGFYNDLVRRNVKMKKFLRGWMNRTNAIYKA